MALHDTYDTNDSTIPTRLKLFLSRRAHELIGSAIIACVVAAGVSLATWSALDPSLNHATDTSPTNLLGAPGAVIADELFRFLGLAVLVLLFVPLAWALKFLSHERPSSLRSVLGFWLLSVISAACFFSALAAPANWPMASGMGGQVGDIISGGLMVALAFALKGILSNLVVAIASLGLAGWSALRAMQLSSQHASANLKATGGMAGSFFAKTRDVFAFFGQSIAGVKAKALQRRPQADRSSAPSLGASHTDGNDIIGRLAPAQGFARGKRKLEPVLVEPSYDEWSDNNEAIDAEAPAAIKSTARGKSKRRISSTYELPDLELLSEPKRLVKTTDLSEDALEENARALEGVLDDFGVKGQIVAVRPGPVVTLYELEPAPGIKSSRVISLADDIARSMSAISARVAVVQGRNAIGIELPNAKRETVYLREMFAADAFMNTNASLSFALGKNIGGEPIYADLARMPHLLIAGTTGSGKSVGINTMILSLLYRLPPDRCKLIMIDPKMLELSVYEGIPHLLAPVVTDPRKAVVALKWAVREMEERYKKMSKVGVRNIDGYNARVNQLIEKGEKLSRTVQTGFNAETGEPCFEQEEMETSPMPFIVVIIDVMADLMMVAGKDIEGAVQRLAQMARAAGIHVVMATQRPSVDVITGTIKANFPTRISFQVTSKIDSRTILGEMGAEQLLGQGDMLYMAGGGRISRLHGPFVSDGEVEAIVKHLKAQGSPDYVEAVTEETDDEAYGEAGEAGEIGNSGDNLYDQAVAVVLRDKKVSTSYIQRRLQIGYNKAASLIERMEKEGLISSANATGKREILVPGDSARG